MAVSLRLKRRLTSGEIVRDWVTVAGDKLAIIVVDMWDSHWCSGAAKRMHLLAPKLNLFLKRLRRFGAHVIHAPSGVAGDVTVKGAAKLLPMVRKENFPVIHPLHEPKFPLDTSDWGCSTGEWPPTAVWTGEHPALESFCEDYACDDGTAIRAFLASKGVERTLLVGVHVNMCVLDVDFGARSMVSRGFQMVVVRDMGDIMYNPVSNFPHVSRARAFVLTLRHIETYICSTISSREIVAV